MTQSETQAREAYVNQILAEAIMLRTKLRGTMAGDYIASLLAAGNIALLEGAVIEERHHLSTLAEEK